VKLLLTRDSVAIGDDINAPHLKETAIDESATSLDLARQILKMRYLANIGTGEATWSMATDIPVAIIAQQWEEPKLISPGNSTVKELAKGEDCLEVHINYHCQEDPDETLEKLKNEAVARATIQAHAVGRRQSRRR